MESNTITEGIEVFHPAFGRGNVADASPSKADEMPAVTVYFYRAREQREVPIYSISAAEAVTSTDTKEGTHGLHVTVDDGFYTLFLEPDGKGTGYSVSLHAGNAQLDAAHLSAEEFV